MIGYPYPKGNIYHGFSGGDNISFDATFAAPKYKKDHEKITKSLKLGTDLSLSNSKSFLNTPHSKGNNSRFSLMRHTTRISQTD